MKKILKSFLSQDIINNFYHLPKAVLANMVYHFPAKGEARQRWPTRGLKVIGVTGTDGKTTTVNMIYQILRAAGKKVSMVSTVNAVIAGKSYDTGFHVTSPDPFSVQKFAKEALDHKDEYLVLEITSHALDQYRFWGINFDIGVITNITHEHLDYHKSFRNYFNTKLKLIQDAKFAVVNQAIGENKGNWGNKADKVMTFGLNKGDFNQKEVKLKLKVPGGYNIENGLAALAVAFSLQINRKVAQRALENFSGVKGRMEEVRNNKGVKIVIDFAHTPNALEQALKTLASQASQTWSGRLVAVFGSAGQRDIQKRGLMGEVAGRLADLVVVTAEDPRGELETINKQIAAGLVKSGKVLDRTFFVVNDRKKALELAINQLARKGDTVGIFGKGHEQSMNLDGTKEIPWSDRKAVEEILKGNQEDKGN